MEVTESARRWTVEDVLNVKAVSDAQISPDGEWIVFVVRAQYGNADDPLARSAIWIVDTAGGEPRRLTQGPNADSFPRWSPDGRTLAFVSDRSEPGAFDLYTMPLIGGEAGPVAETTGVVGAPQWSPDGEQIAFLRTDPDTEDERRRVAEKDDAIEFERNPKFQRLWVVGADGSEPRAVPTGDVQVWEFDWLPNGRSFAAVCSDHPYEWSWYNSRLALANIEGGELASVWQTDRQLAAPTPSPSGEYVAFFAGYWSDRGVVSGDVYVAATHGDREAICLTTGYPASFSWAVWRDDESLLALGYEDGEAGLFRLSLSEPPTRLWNGEVLFADRNWAKASITRSGGMLAVVREDGSHPADVWTAEAPGEDSLSDGVEWVQRTRLQPELDELPTGRPTTLRWTAPDGLPIQGVLLTPEDRRLDERLPMVTIVHGGPTGMYHHGFVASYYWAPTLLASGFAVFLPNFRGSTGWGAEFAEANLGDMGGRDFADILSGIDSVIESGRADPEKLYIAGWSYGGFMSAWAITQTDRFKAAIVGASISNWLSFHGVSNLSEWDKLFYRADAYDIAGPFVQFSPIYHADTVRTPTLILHGEADPYVPVGQGYEFFRALKERGVEVEMVAYPREGHGFTERKHMEHLFSKVAAWCGSHR